MPPDFFVDEQLAQWRWDSHLFAGGHKDIDKWFDEPLHCIWCGWRPPSEMPLDHAHLCPENPVIKSHVRVIGDKLAKGLSSMMADIKGGDSNGRG
jgi:hypothetical protein